MWARFTVLNETPIASAIAGCAIPLSRSNTIWMRSRCATGIFHRSAVFSSRICFLVHLTIRPPESDSHSESYRASGRETEKYRKPLDSISYGSGMSYSIQREDAYLVALTLRDFPNRQYWEDGRQMPVCDLRTGQVDFHDLKRDPVALLDKPYHDLFFYLPRCALDAI